MKTQIESMLGELLSLLPSLPEHHKPTAPLYRFFDQVAKKEAEALFSDFSKEAKPFGPFGSLALPFFEMGAITSKDLLGLDELILFSFYWTNRHRYKKALDIGANIGLHTVLMEKCGFAVQSFEPDPLHFSQLQEVLHLNSCLRATPHQGAVSNKEGEAEFVRVLGNTTSSHLSGSKQPYGALERFPVKVYDIRSLIGWADLIKMDVEGHEDAILLATSRKDWETTDALLEIGSAENGEKIFRHLQRENVHAFAQKNGWKKVSSLEEMPSSYRDGSLFISTKPSMPWGE